MINAGCRLDKNEGMFLVKFIKMFNTLKPFFAEIFLGGETDKEKVAQNKLLTIFTILVGINVFLFTNDVFVFNAPWSREDSKEKNGSEEKSTDPNKVWLEFLEDQLKDHVNDISELERQLAEANSELDKESELNAKLKEEITSLKAKISLLKTQIEKGANSREIYERLRELEVNRNGN